jgi:uncharacterized protein YhaN
MTLLELALKGVRNFTGFTRIPFHAGLNVVYGGNQSGKSTIWQVLKVQLTGQPSDGTEESNDWGQAALSFRGDDGQTYSLASYFREQRHQLGRREADGHFERVTLPGNDHNPWTPSVNGDPSLWPLCLGGIQWLPSQQLSAPSTSAPVTSATNTALVALGPAQQRLDQLDHLENVTQQAKQLESDLAECYGHRTLLTERLDQLENIRQEQQRVSDSLNELAAAASISNEDEGQLVGYLDDEAALRERMVALDQTIVRSEDDLDGYPRVLLLKRPLFHFGWALSGIGGGLYYLFGLYPLVMGCSGLGGVLLIMAISRSITQGSKLRRMSRGIVQLKAELAELEAPLNHNYTDLLTTLESLGFPSPRAAFGARQRLHQINDRLKRLEEAGQQILDGQSHDALKDELNTLAKRIDAIQEEHAVLQANAGDAAAIKRERDTLEEAVDQALSPTADSHGGLDISIEPHLAQEPGYRAALDRRHAAYTTRASDYLKHFTGGEFTDLEVHNNYYPILHGDQVDQPGQQRPGSGMADLIYLSQYLAMVETLDPKGSFPLILDEPFLTLDADRRDMVYSALQECSRGRQVVLLTCQKFMTSPADHMVLL